MPNDDQAKIERLEKEIKILKIRLDVLIRHLNQSKPSFGPPDGGNEYDQQVKAALEKEKLF